MPVKTDTSNFFQMLQPAVQKNTSPARLAVAVPAVARKMPAATMAVPPAAAVGATGDTAVSVSETLKSVSHLSPALRTFEPLSTL